MKKFTTVDDVVAAFTDKQFYTHFAKHFKLDISSDDLEDEFNAEYAKLVKKGKKAVLDVANAYVEKANEVVETNGNLKDAIDHNGTPIKIDVSKYNGDNKIEREVLEVQGYNKLVVFKENGKNRAAVLKLKKRIPFYLQDKETGENHLTFTKELHISYGVVKLIAKRAGLVKQQHHLTEVEGKEFEFDVDFLNELNSILKNTKIDIYPTYHEAGEPFVSSNGGGEYSNDCITNQYYPQADKIALDRDSYSRALAALNSRPM